MRVFEALAANVESLSATKLRPREERAEVMRERNVSPQHGIFVSFTRAVIGWRNWSRGHSTDHTEAPLPYTIPLLAVICKAPLTEETVIFFTQYLCISTIKVSFTMWNSSPSGISVSLFVTRLILLLFGLRPFTANQVYNLSWRSIDRRCWCSLPRLVWRSFGHSHDEVSQSRSRRQTTNDGTDICGSQKVSCVRRFCDVSPKYCPNSCAESLPKLTGCFRTYACPSYSSCCFVFEQLPSPFPLE